MCYYVASKITDEQIVQLEHDFVLKWEEEERTDYYLAAPHNYPNLPVLTSEKRFRLLRWPMIPHYARNWTDAVKYRGACKNAVSATVDSLKSYKPLIENENYCVIPVNGFFEWHHGKTEKYPHYIYPSNHELLYFAGIYTTWTNTALNEKHDGFSILTTDPNERMRWLHNSPDAPNGPRMPAILSLENARLWLDRSIKFEDKKHILVPAPTSVLKDHPISKLITTRVKGVNPNVPAVQEPFQYADVEA